MAHPNKLILQNITNDSKWQRQPLWVKSEKLSIKRLSKNTQIVAVTKKSSKPSNKRMKSCLTRRRETYTISMVKRDSKTEVRTLAWTSLTSSDSVVAEGSSKLARRRASQSCIQ